MTALAFIPVFVEAATITVCQVGCDFQSIQGAVNQASSGDTIQIQSTIPITEPDVIVDNSVSIVGLGTSATVIQGAGMEDAAPARVFWILPGNTVDIRDLTIRYGRDATTGGGCILNEGTLQLENVVVTHCHSDSPNAGGAIFNSGYLELIASEIAHSISDYDARGGGLANHGTLLAIDCVIRNNTGQDSNFPVGGGGLYNTGSATLNRCEITQNTLSFGRGAGVGSSGSLELRGSRVLANSGFSGIDVWGGTALIERSLISGHSGTGVTAAEDAEVSIRNSTIDSNGNSGVAACSSAPVRIVNSTISSNLSNGSGGGISVCSQRAVKVANSTIVNNTADLDADGDGDGGGIFLKPPSDCNPICIQTKVEIRNSILANNTDNSPSGYRHSHDCDGALHSQGNNLLEAASPAGAINTCTVHGVTSGVMLGVDPLLEPFSAHFGQWPVHMPKDGSPVVNAGDPAGCTDFNSEALAFDQNGSPRDSACDLGSVEFGSAPPIFGDRFESSF